MVEVRHRSVGVYADAVARAPAWTYPGHRGDTPVSQASFQVAGHAIINRWYEDQHASRGRELEPVGNAERSAQSVGEVGELTLHPRTASDAAAPPDRDLRATSPSSSRSLAPRASKPSASRPRPPVQRASLGRSPARWRTSNPPCRGSMSRTKKPDRSSDQPRFSPADRSDHARIVSEFVVASRCPRRSVGCFPGELHRGSLHVQSPSPVTPWTGNT